jgi:hypothetical protein
MQFTRRTADVSATAAGFQNGQLEMFKSEAGLGSQEKVQQPGN